MQTYGEWAVDLTVTGPITVIRPLNLEVEKGSRSPFWTTAGLKAVGERVHIQVIVRAHDQEEANDAAVYFVGQTLDVLSLNLNLPIYLSLTGSQFRPFETQVKRIVTEDEWSESFKLGRDFGIDRPVFSRALSWFRKGLTSEDPIDKLIAWWSSIEGVGSKFARKTEKAQLGAINQVCDCFEQLWTDVSKWRAIPNQAVLVNEFHHARNAISHGFISVDIDNVRQIASHLPKLRELAYAFLSDWAVHGPNPEPRSSNSAGFVFDSERSAIDRPVS